MSRQQREIQFFKTMAIDKRAQEAAYLRQNLFDSKTAGLYPSLDFAVERPDDEFTTDKKLIDVVGHDEDVFERKVLIESNDDIDVYNYGSNTKLDEINNVGYECGVFGDDGVHIAVSDGKLYRLNHTNGNTVEIGDFGSLGGPEPHTGTYDGLYYWYISVNEIYKQLGDDAPTIAFNNVGMRTRFVCPFNQQLVLFGQVGGSIQVLFWDKSDQDLFEKRIIINNARLLAAGVVDGRLMLVKSVGNSSNNKERTGEIVVTYYDGERFTRLNSIKAGDDDVELETETAMDVGNEVMVLALANNQDDHNPHLYQNWVLKIRNNGAIEVQHLPDSAHGSVHVVQVARDYTILGQRGDGTNPPRILQNRATDEDYGNYERFDSGSTYITNFLNNAYNRHTLSGVAVVFEQLFEQTETTPELTGEQLDIYFRTSEREDFTFLGEVTVEKVKQFANANVDYSAEYADDTKGLPEQMYMITEMPDGSPLPEYNEIQFKFVSLRGFSVIQAWYYYEYVERNTIG